MMKPKESVGRMMKPKESVGRAEIARPLDIERARALIAACKKVDEAKDLRDKALAMATYLRIRDASEEARDDACEIVIRAERRLGELSPPKPAGRPKEEICSSPERISKPAEEAESKALSRKVATRARALAAIPEPEFEGRVKKAREEGRLSVPAVLQQSSSPDYDSDEQYTPPFLIELITSLFGGKIDLDPASCDEANKIVGARKYFTKETNGLTRAWNGDVFMNQPYSHPLVSQFALKLLEEIDAGRTKRSVMLVNNASSTPWFQKFLDRYPSLSWAGRLAFVPQGYKEPVPVGSARNGSVLFFQGFALDRIAEVFAGRGTITVSIGQIEPMLRAVEKGRKAKS